MDERRNQPEYADSQLKWRYNFTKVAFTFWKTVKMYGGENERIDEEIKAFRDVLDFFFKTQESLKITFDGIDVKVDHKHRVRGRRADDVYFEDLYDLFISICLSEIELTKGVTNDELLALFRTIGKFPLGREPKIKTYERFLSMIPEELPHVNLQPYDPEEAGNLPIFSPSQRLANIYAILAEEFLEQQELYKTNETLPLKVIERSAQDLLAILLNNMHGKVWDFALMLATTRAYKDSLSAAETVNRVFLAAMVSLVLSLDKIEAKYLLLAAFFQSLGINPQKGFFATSRMRQFYIGRAVIAVNSAMKVKDYHADTITSPDARQGNIFGEILKAVSYYLAVTNSLYPQHLVDQQFLPRFTALQNMNKLAMKKGFVPEIIAALRSAVGAMPCGSLVTYENGSKVAVVVGRPENGSNNIPVVAVDHTMKIQDTALLSIDAIQPVAQEQLIELPPETVAEILNSFLTADPVDSPPIQQEDDGEYEYEEYEIDDDDDDEEMPVYEFS